MYYFLYGTKKNIFWNEVAERPSARNLRLYSLLAVFRQQRLRILQTGQGQGKHSSIGLHTPNPDLNPRAKKTIDWPLNSKWKKTKTDSKKKRQSGDFNVLLQHFWGWWPTCLKVSSIKRVKREKKPSKLSCTTGVGKIRPGGHYVAHQAF